MSDLRQGDRRTPRVLIVDDDPEAIRFLADRCAKMGLNVHTAANGLQALIAVRQQAPDALIVDVHMPELDGISLCSHLLEPGHKAIDLIVVSGYTESETKERCESFGANYVAKGPDLWEKVRASLEKIFPAMSVEIEDPVWAAPKKRERPLVLVIDDDPEIGRFLTSRLQKCGADVLCSPDGNRGYQVAAREKPDVILSDYYMPEADIYFLLWRLRSTPSTAKTPVLLMTGYRLTPGKERELMRGFGGQLGVEHIFQKPIEIDALFGTIGHYCDMKFRPGRAH